MHVGNNDSGCGGRGDSEGHVAVWWWHGGDDDNKVNCGDDLDGDSDDSNNGDGVDDDVNINGRDYTNRGYGEGINEFCGGNSIGVGDVDTNGGSDLDFGDGKTKVDCSDNKAGDDGNSNDDGGPNDSGGVDTNDNNCVRDNADTGGDNKDVADGDKNDDDGNDTDASSNDEGGGGNDEGGNSADGDARDGGIDDGDDKDFKDDDGVKSEFLQFNFVNISITFEKPQQSITHLTDGGTYNSFAFHKTCCVLFPGMPQFNVFHLIPSDILGWQQLYLLLSALKDVIYLLEYHDCYLFFYQSMLLLYSVGVVDKPYID